MFVYRMRMYDMTENSVTCIRVVHDNIEAKD